MGAEFHVSEEGYREMIRKSEAQAVAWRRSQESWRQVAVAQRKQQGQGGRSNA